MYECNILDVVRFAVKQNVNSMNGIDEGEVSTSPITIQFIILS
jgi:hypothetical protein